MRPTTDYDRIERAIRFIESNARRQPTLAEIATHVGLSEFHFQRLFRRWAGISPKRFLQYVTAEAASDLLRRSRPVLETAYATGLSGPGRLHDLMVNAYAATPGEVGAGGTGLRIAYGFHPTPFGECLLATTDRGVCWLGFVIEGRGSALERLRRYWPGARFDERTDAGRALVERMFSGLGVNGTGLLLRGTNFQLRVWDALLRIPAGSVSTYGGVAAAVGRPGAARAVGNAVGANPIAFLVPCHRVIRETGAFGGYAAGVQRKKAILAWEQAHLARKEAS